MKVYILGAGRRGTKLARHLVEENREVVLLDEKPSNIERAMSAVDCMGCVCSATDTEELKAAGVDSADAFVALTGSDETNLVSCGIVGATFKVSMTIAAVRGMSYTQTDSSIMGITHIVNPQQAVAAKILSEIQQGLFTDTIKFGDSDLLLYNLAVKEDSPLCGTTIKDMRSKVPGQYIVAAFHRDSGALVPDGDTSIQPGDILSVIMKGNLVSHFLAAIGIAIKKANKIAITGSSKVTDFLLKGLSSQTRRNVTVITKDKDVCLELSEKYTEATIINANIASEGIFREENIASFDLFIGTTDNDELNIITASYAKKIGVRNSMALLTKTPDYLVMAKHLGIDNLISEQDVTADSIMTYLHGTSVSSMYTLFNGQLQAFEIVVSKDSKCNGQLLKDINMRGKAIIAGIHKGNGETIIPNGLYRIETSDTLVIVMPRNSLETIQDLLGIIKEE